VATESNKIANSTSLDTEQKISALAGLADQTRNQVKTALGNDIGTAYLSTSMRWLNGMATGNAISFPSTGYINTYKSVIPPTPQSSP
jgi:hypothetical protein